MKLTLILGFVLVWSGSATAERRLILSITENNTHADNHFVTYHRPSQWTTKKDDLTDICLSVFSVYKVWKKEEISCSSTAGTDRNKTLSYDVAVQNRNKTVSNLNVLTCLCNKVGNTKRDKILLMNAALDSSGSSTSIDTTTSIDSSASRKTKTRKSWYSSLSKSSSSKSSSSRNPSIPKYCPPTVGDGYEYIYLLNDRLGGVGYLISKYYEFAPN